MSERQIGAQPPDQDCKDVLPHTAQSSDGKDTKDRKKFSVSYLLEKESTVALSSSKDDTDVEQTSPSAPTPALAIFSPTSSSSESSVSPVSPLMANFINNPLMDPNVQAFYHLLISQLNNSAVNHTGQMDVNPTLNPFGGFPVNSPVLWSPSMFPMSQIPQLMQPNWTNVNRRQGGSRCYTQHQLDRLKQRFDQNNYITGHERAQLAHELGLSKIQVKRWFQNRRQRGGSQGK